MYVEGDEGEGGVQVGEPRWLDFSSLQTLIQSNIRSSLLY